MIGNNMPPDMGPIGGGEMISGKWINKLTGQTVTIRNTIIDGDNMVIITDAGQIDMNEFSSNYIQASDEIYNEEGKVIGREEMEFQPMYDVTSVNNIIERKSKAHQQPKESEELKIIKKVFSKIESTPSISMDIQWDDFPKDQLDTLINFLDISINDISKYIVKTYMDTSSISLLVTEFLKEKLNKI